VEDIALHIKNRQKVNYISAGEKAGPGFVENSYFYGSHSLKRLTMMKNFRRHRTTATAAGCAPGYAPPKT
jgi:hypothetical protein